MLTTIISVFILTLSLQLVAWAQPGAPPKFKPPQFDLKRPRSQTPNEELGARFVELARAEGCLDGLSGKFEARTRTFSSCFAGGFVTETFVRHACEGCETSAVVASIMSHCSDEATKIRCIKKSGTQGEMEHK